MFNLDISLTSGLAAVQHIHTGSHVLPHAEAQAQDLVAAASQLLQMFLPGYRRNQLQQSRRSEDLLTPKVPEQQSSSMLHACSHARMYFLRRSPMFADGAHLQLPLSICPCIVHGHASISVILDSCAGPWAYC